MTRGVRAMLALAAVVVSISGCSDRRQDLTAVKDEPLASPTLLDMQLTHEVESAGTHMEDAYVWRAFRSSDPTGLQLFEAIRQVGLDAGWSSWTCNRSGGAWLLFMRHGNPGLWAQIQVDGSEADVKVGKDRPDSHSGPSDFANEDAFACS